MSEPPKRIISLVPSITLTLFDLGAGDLIIGRTKFCIHPSEKVRSIPTIGGTKKVNFEKIKSLSPDLIIANHEENTKEMVETLRKSYNVELTDVRSFDDNEKFIARMGEITGKQKEAAAIINSISDGFSEMKKYSFRSTTSAYLIWKDPYMAVGNYTFINDILGKSGFDNVFNEFPRYPKISIEQLKAKNPELIMLSSEPFPFKEKHITELRSYLPESKIILVDGEMFSWFGSKISQTPAYIKSLRSFINII